MNRSDDRRHRLRDLRDDRRRYDHSKPRKGPAGKVIVMLVLVGVVGLVVSRAGCNATVQQAHSLPAKKSLAKLKPADLQQQTAEYGIEGGAVAAMKVISASKQIATGPADDAPEPEVKATRDGFVVTRVRSVSPHVLPRDREQAIDEAKAEARRLLVEQGKVPPGEWKLAHGKVTDVPPDDKVREAWEKGGLGTDRGWVEIDEVTLASDTIRGERAKDRTAQAGFWFGTAFLGLLAAYGFLRLDMWTKGYLTLVLGVVVGAVVVAGVIGLGLLIW
jgi:hypothetical protein